MPIGQGGERAGSPRACRKMATRRPEVREVDGVGVPVVAGLHGDEDEGRLDEGRAMSRSVTSEDARYVVEARPEVSVAGEIR